MRVSAVLALATLVACGPEKSADPKSEGKTAGETELTDSGVVDSGGEGGPSLPTSNILLIIADDMGADKVGAYADDADPDYRAAAEHLPDTPVLDHMSEVGVRFTDAWANAQCSPTRAALYTGRYAFRNGVGEPLSSNAGTPLSFDEVNIAEALTEVGYTTGLFGKWHLGENAPPADWDDEESWEDHVGETLEHEINPISHGWQRFVGSLEGSLAPHGGSGGGYTDWVALETECVDGDVHEVTVHHREEYATEATINDALEWIEAQDGPWFAAVALNAPHTPIEGPPEGCSYRVDGDAAPDTNQGIYEEMVECVDLRIGEMFAQIPDIDDTLIVFMGDNGTLDTLAEHVFDDGRGKNTVYESGVRVPLIIADGRAMLGGPDDEAPIPTGEDSPNHVTVPGPFHEPVHVTDLFATFAAIGGAEVPQGDSVSLLPALRDYPVELGRVIISETYGSDGLGQAAMRATDWKLHVNVIAQSGEPCRVSYKLYNLAEDRFELEDLVTSEPEVLEEMIDRLDARIGTQAHNSWLSVTDC